MNTLLKSAAVVAALVATLAPAKAGQNVTLPPAMLGTWCLDMRTTEDSERYKRGECDVVEQVELGPRTFNFYENRCNLIRASKTTDAHYRDIFTLRYRCIHGGGQTYHETFDVWLGKADNLTVNTKRTPWN
jgi:hypothetical protein